MAETIININVNNGNDGRENLNKAIVAADTVVNRLLFLKETFEALSDPNCDGVKFSSYGLYGFYEILEGLLIRRLMFLKFLTIFQEDKN